MIRRACAVVFVTLAFNSSLAAQRPTSVIDQENLPQPPPVATTFALGGPSEQVLSQIVTAGVTGRLTEVQVPVGGCAAGGQLVLEIRDVDSSTGQPGARVLARRSFISPSTLFPNPITDEFQLLPIAGALNFTAGDTFAIVLADVGGSCGVWPAPAGDTYPDGTAWADTNDGPIVPLSLSGTDDLPFLTIMRVR